MPQTYGDTKKRGAQRTDMRARVQGPQKLTFKLANGSRTCHGGATDPMQEGGGTKTLRFSPVEERGSVRYQLADRAEDASIVGTLLNLGDDIGQHVRTVSSSQALVR